MIWTLLTYLFKLATSLHSILLPSPFSSFSSLSGIATVRTPVNYPSLIHVLVWPSHINSRLGHVTCFDLCDKSKYDIWKSLKTLQIWNFFFSGWKKAQLLSCFMRDIGVTFLHLCQPPDMMWAQPSWAKPNPNCWATELWQIHDCWAESPGFEVVLSLSNG